MEGAKVKELFNGTIVDGRIIVPDKVEAGKIYNKGRTGHFIKGGALSLSFVEAFYLMNEEKLMIEGHSIEEFLKYAVQEVQEFEVRYLVYCDLRNRGFIVSDEEEMKATRGGENSREYDVIPVYERAPFSFNEIYEKVMGSGNIAGKKLMQAIDKTGEDAKGIASGANGDQALSRGEKDGWFMQDTEEGGYGFQNGEIKVLQQAHEVSHEKYEGVREGEKIFAVVDGDGDITYYTIRAEDPRALSGWKFKDTVKISFLGEMGLVDDFGDLHKKGFYGKTIGKNLHLSGIECIYLAEKGNAEIRDMKGKKRSVRGIKKEMAAKDPEFEQKVRIYSDLRDRGLVVKTGFKYGTHFRVYVKDIEHHAPYLVHAVPENYVGTWPEISRGVRLAHGVKKEFLLAEASEKPGYLRIKRVRM